MYSQEEIQDNLLPEAVKEIYVLPGTTERALTDHKIKVQIKQVFKLPALVTTVPPSNDNYKFYEDIITVDNEKKDDSDKVDDFMKGYEVKESTDLVENEDPSAKQNKENLEQSIKSDIIRIKTNLIDNPSNNDDGNDISDEDEVENRKLVNSGNVSEASNKSSSRIHVPKDEQKSSLNLESYAVSENVIGSYDLSRNDIAATETKNKSEAETGEESGNDYSVDFEDQSSQSNQNPLSLINIKSGNLDFGEKSIFFKTNTSDSASVSDPVSASDSDSGINAGLDYLLSKESSSTPDQITGASNGDLKGNKGDLTIFFKTNETGSKDLPDNPSDGSLNEIITTPVSSVDYKMGSYDETPLEDNKANATNFILPAGTDYNFQPETFVDGVAKIINKMPKRFDSTMKNSMISIQTLISDKSPEIQNSVVKLFINHADQDLQSILSHLKDFLQKENKSGMFFEYSALLLEYYEINTKLQELNTLQLENNIQSDIKTLERFRSLLNDFPDIPGFFDYYCIQIILRNFTSRYFIQTLQIYNCTRYFIQPLQI